MGLTLLLLLFILLLLSGGWIAPGNGCLLLFLFSSCLPRGLLLLLFSTLFKLLILLLMLFLLMASGEFWRFTLLWLERTLAAIWYSDLAKAPRFWVLTLTGFIKEGCLLELEVWWLGIAELCDWRIGEILFSRLLFRFAPKCGLSSGALIIPDNDKFEVFKATSLLLIFRELFKSGLKGLSTMKMNNKKKI